MGGPILGFDGSAYREVAVDGSGLLRVGAKLSASDALTRLSGTTGYTANDALGTNLAITGATNATPIVITCDAHGLADGDPVTIASVGGNTNANGNYYAKVTGYSTVTFGVYTDKALTTAKAGNSNFTSGGTVARMLRFKNVVRVVGGKGYVVKVRLFTDDKTCTAAFKLQLFNAPPSAILDNVAYPLLYANRLKRVGEVVLSALATKDAATSDCAAAIATIGDGSNLPLAFECAATDTDLYGIIVAPAFTPVASTTFWFEITTEVD